MAELCEQRRRLQGWHAVPDHCHRMRGAKALRDEHAGFGLGTVVRLDNEGR